MTESLTSECQSLIEQIHDWQTEAGTVDAANRIVRNIALTGTESKNGYRYAEAALEAGVTLYENKPVFLDHPASPGKPHQRSTRDLVGSIVNVRFENKRVRGDIRVLDTEAGRTFLALAESNGPAVGMSHVILAEKNAEGSVVEKIHEGVSVDAVVFPATTNNFQEQHAAGGDRERNALAAEIAELEEKRDRLRAEIEIEQWIAEANLPPAAVTESFRNQLRRAGSSDARRSLIEERRQLIEQFAGQTLYPLSQERRADSASASDCTDEQLIAAIRRSGSA